MKNSEFIIDRVPITKEEVRSISLSKLELEKAKIMVDIGSGTGSISVEAAYINPNLKVYSIEKNAKAFELTAKNIEKFALKNVEQIQNNAPCDLDKSDLNSRVDCIFMGGSGQNTKEIIKWSYDLLKIGGKFVANFILIENLIDTKNYLSECGFKDIEVSQVIISKLEKLGKGNFLKPENPIFIIEGKK